MREVTSKFENEKLTILFHDRIDTSNANLVGDEVKKICEEYVTENVVLDVEDLDYISSAGLRVVLRLKKDKKDMYIINAKTDIYEILEMTGFTEMIKVEKAYRQLVVDGCEVIGSGAKGTVYRYSQDTIVKVFNDENSLDSIRNEKDLAKKAFVKGIPTAISFDICKVGNKYASVYELLNAKSYSDLIISDPKNLDAYVKEYANLLKLIHSTSVSEGEMPDGKRIIRKWTSTTCDYLDKAEAEKLEKLVDDIPDKLCMLHLDYHTNNIMKQGDETLLIDMDTVSHGHPIIELSVIYSTFVGFNEMDKDNTIKFLKIDSDVCKKIWDIFIDTYFDSDLDMIKYVEERVKLLSYCRIVRYTFRNNKDKGLADAIIDNAVKHVKEMLKNIDNLSF